MTNDEARTPVSSTQQSFRSTKEVLVGGRERRRTRTLIVTLDTVLPVERSEKQSPWRGKERRWEAAAYDVLDLVPQEGARPLLDGDVDVARALHHLRRLC